MVISLFNFPSRYNWYTSSKIPYPPSPFQMDIPYRFTNCARVKTMTIQTVMFPIFQDLNTMFKLSKSSTSVET